ncbi:hypothetical protein GGS20DRAFT_466839 [Poronia punctata]|nr:hypothetical protein GGS20DRAFT_466839 [Poronia punctata]
MASSERQPRKKLLAREIVEFSDEELDRYLSDNKLGQTTLISVEDPKNLPESFIQRLRDRAKGAAANSRPVDLAQVTARLLENPAYDRTLPRLSTPSPGRELVPTAPPSPEDIREKGYYTRLVELGGRPAISSELVDDVIRDPEEHRHLFSAWADSSDEEEWLVARCQLEHWAGFRHWQPCARGGESSLAPCDWRDSRWHVFDPHRSFFVKFRSRNETYTEGAKKLLEAYDFVHSRPFEFLDDFRQQDKLTTWIEYAVYTCAEHYDAQQTIDCSRPDWDKAWQALVNEGMLRPHETLEYLYDHLTSHATIRQQEEDVAFDRWKSAEIVLCAQQANERVSESGRSDIVASVESCTARAQLNAAEERLSEVRERNRRVAEFFCDTNEYDDMMHKMACSTQILQWIKEQLPVVEAEMNELDAVKISANTARGKKRRREKEAMDTGDQISPKRQRKTRNSIRNLEGESVAGRNAGPESDSFNPAEDRGGRAVPDQRKANTVGMSSLEKEDAPSNQHSVVSKPLRRSARIAALKQKKAPEIPSGAARSPARVGRTRTKVAPQSKESKSRREPTRLTEQGVRRSSRHRVTKTKTESETRSRGK